MALICAMSVSVGCPKYRDDLKYDHPVEYTWVEPGLAGDFTLFQGVSWDRAISEAAIPLIATKSLVDNRRVLDLFCGPGFITILCADENPKEIVSVAEHELAEDCTRYNIAARAHDGITKVIRYRAQPTAPEQPTNQVASLEPFPSLGTFDVVIATLSDSLFDARDIETKDRIELLLKCVEHHLQRSGRAFVICEPGDTRQKLENTCQVNGKKLLPALQEQTRWAVLEIRPITVP